MGAAIATTRAVPTLRGRLARRLRRRSTACGAVSAAIRFDRTGPARTVSCCLPAGHSSIPGWPCPLHVAADGTRFRTAEEVR